jgi:hypothetical protein
MSSESVPDRIAVGVETQSNSVTGWSRPINGRDNTSSRVLMQSQEHAYRFKVGST